MSVHEDLQILNNVAGYAYRSLNGRSYCPVLRNTAKGDEWGFVVAKDGLMEPTVYLEVLFRYFNFEPKFEEKEDTGIWKVIVIKPVRDLPNLSLPKNFIRYDSTLAMLEAGWIVD